jgi:hypothetical protein
LRGPRSGNDEEGKKDRAWLVQHNGESLQDAAVDATANGLSERDFVVFIADTRDPLGRQMASVFYSSRGTTVEEEERSVPPGRIPTSTGYMDMTLAKATFRPLHPRFLVTLQALPESGKFWAVCVAAGGATLFQHEVRFGKRGDG